MASVDLCSLLKLSVVLFVVVGLCAPLVRAFQCTVLGECSHSVINPTLRFIYTKKQMAQVKMKVTFSNKCTLMNEQLKWDNIGIFSPKNKCYVAVFTKNF
jgi:hypothetical protein